MTVGTSGCSNHFLRFDSGASSETGQEVSPDPTTSIASTVKPTSTVTPEIEPLTALIVESPPMEPPVTALIVESPPMEPPVPEKDIWARLRTRFRLPSCEEVPGAEKWATWYAGKSAYMKRVQERAAPLLYLVAEELEARDLPGELALLPIVESAYNPFAYSHGRAAGLWQFIPSTARENGLKQNWWYDGRRDIHAATQAALTFVQRLGDRFDEDWLVVLAAYNGGPNRVGRQVKKLRRNNGIPSYAALKLPRETQTYVPKVVGLGCLFKNPEKYAFDIAFVPNKPQLTLVDSGGQIDLALAAELAGMSLDELYRFNPAFNRWATDPDGPDHLLLPQKNADMFQQSITAVSTENRVTWKRERIREGDTLGHIAKRNHVTVKILQAANQLDNSHKIRAGHYLLIPQAKYDQDDYRFTSSQRMKRVKEIKRKGVRQTHLVKSGESLWTIARRYNLHVRELAQWNGMAPGDVLSIGKNLVLWTAKGGDATPPASMLLASSAPTTQVVHYKIRRGDSLWRIANRFGLSVDKVRNWNDLQGKDLLQPGQVLTLHVDVRSGI